MGGPLLVVAAAVDRLELAQGTQPGRTNWVDLVPLFIIPVVVVGGAWLYGGVIATATDERPGQPSGQPRLAGVAVSAVVLIGWTVLCLIAALVSQTRCTDEPVRVPEPGGLLFAAALFAWASPFVVSAVRRKGLAWWVVGTLAVVVAVWWTVDLYANPIDYTCPG